MAERRMFAKSVIGSARFLTMPPSSRLLYYDLGMQADDDGVVEAFSVMRMTGAVEDDLKVLVSKGFVQLLNEEMVAYITDWSQNNRIRKDRYHQGIYKDLLVCLGDIGNQMTTKWQPDDNQMTTKWQPRLGKDRLGKDRLGKDRLVNTCAELPSSSTPPAEPPAILLPLNDGTEYPIQEAVVKEWAELFPAVDVMQELRSMRAWLDANTQRRKTRRGVKKFVVGWLSREQDRGGKKAKGKSETEAFVYDYGDTSGSL